MTSPDKQIRWAEGADVADISDPATERTSGYKFQEDYPNAQHNSQQRNLARWTGDGFVSPADFINIAVDLQVAPINSNDYDAFFPLQVETTASADQNEAWGIFSDGRHLFVLEGDPGAPILRVAVYDRDDLSTTLAVDAAFAGVMTTPTFEAFSANGEFIAVVVNDTPVFEVHLLQWDPLALTLTHIWSYDAGLFVNDVVVSSDAVYIVHDDDGAAGDNIFRFAFSAGAGGFPRTLVSGDADASVKFQGAGHDPIGVAVGGRYVVVTGPDTSVGNGSQIRIFVDETGMTVVQTRHLGAAINAVRRYVACDGCHGYLVDDGGGVHRFGLRASAGAAAAITAINTIGAPSGGQMSVDQRFLLISDDTNDILSMLDKTTGEQLDFVDLTTGLIITAHASHSDGDRFWLGGLNTPSSIVRLSRPGRAKVWTKVNPVFPFLPYKLRAIAEE